MKRTSFVLTYSRPQPSSPTAATVCTAAPPSRPGSISRRAAFRQLGALALFSLALPAESANASSSAADTADSYRPKRRFGNDEGGNTFHPDWKVGDGRSASEHMRILSVRVLFLAFVASFTSFGRAMSDRESGRVELPEVYDSAAVARYFSLRPDRVLLRLGELAYEALNLSLLAARHKADAMLNDGGLTPGARKLRSESRTKEAATALREAVGRLGPAFVKLAQGVAMRPDIIGITTAQQLQTLQDSVLDPFPVIDALELFKKEMGCSAKAVFDVLDTKPIAGASLGMVFRGVVDGRPVAVKIQRPNVAERIAMDFYIVRTILGLGIRLGGVRKELRGVLDDFAGQVFQELDYREELENILKFKRAYAKVPAIIIPKPYAAYSSKRVLVEEFIYGKKLLSDNTVTSTSGNGNGDDGKDEKLAVIEIGIHFALTQLLDKGLLHGDMHSGNILWTNKGEIALIDFGIVQEIPTNVREAMVLALFYLIQGEYKLLAETLVSLAQFGREIVDEDLPAFAEALAEEFGVSENGKNGKNGRNRKKKNTTTSSSLVERRFTLVGVAEKLLYLGGRFPLVFNTYFLNALRCLAMLEGVAVNSDSNFSVLNVLYPTIMRKILQGEPNGTFKAGLEKVLRADDGSSFQWDKLDRMLNEARKAETEGSMLVLSTSGGGSRKVSGRMRGEASALDDLLLSSKGAFLRRELMREWAGVPRANGVFRRAGLVGKIRALTLFLPMLIMRMILFTVMVAARTVRKLLRIQVQP